MITIPNEISEQSLVQDNPVPKPGVTLRACIERPEDGTLRQRCAETDPAYDGLH